MSKHIVIIEPSSSGIALITEARKMGYSPVVVTYNQDDRKIANSYLNLVDHIIQVDTSNEGQVRNALYQFSKKAKIDAIVPGFEYFVSMAARLNDYFGLPGLDPESVDNLRLKDVMMSTLEEAGVPVPAFGIVTNSTSLEAVAEQVGYPAIIKPTNSSGSLHVSKVHDLGEAREALVSIQDDRFEDLGLQFSENVMFCQYIPGDEFSVEGFKHEGKITFLSVTKKLLTAEPYFAETGHIVSASLPAELQEKIHAYVTAVIEGLGIKFGPFHCEIRVTPEQNILLMEIAARLPGDNIVDLIEMSTGINMAKVMLQTYLGEAIEPAEPQVECCAGICFFTPENGRSFSQYTGLETLKRIPGFVQFELIGVLNQDVAASHSSLSRAAKAIFVGSDFDTVSESITAANQAMQFTDQPEFDKTLDILAYRFGKGAGEASAGKAPLGAYQSVKKGLHRYNLDFDWKEFIPRRHRMANSSDEVGDHPNTFKNADVVLDCVRRHAIQMALSLLKTDHFPLTLGGDHTQGLGAAKGVLFAGIVTAILNKQIAFFKESAQHNYVTFSYLVSQALEINAIGPIIREISQCLEEGFIAQADVTFFLKSQHIIWFDAHGDFNTSEITPSGNSHGFPAASICGVGDQCLVNVVAPWVRINPSNVHYVAIRDLDDAEYALMIAHNVNIHGMDAINALGLSTVIRNIINNIHQSSLTETHSKPTIHLSFDIDGIDAKYVPATGTPVGEGSDRNTTPGPSLEAVIEAFGNIHQYVDTIDISEANFRVDRDPEGITLETVNCLFKAFFSYNQFVATDKVYASHQARVYDETHRSAANETAFYVPWEKKSVKFPEATPKHQGLTNITSSTWINFPGGAVSADGEIVAVLDLGLKGQAIVLDRTAFHPIDSRWPDQASDRGLIRYNGTQIPIAHCIIVGIHKSNQQVIYGEQLDQLQKANYADWYQVVAHILPENFSEDLSYLIGLRVSTQVSPELRAQFSRQHTASHVSAFALSQSLVGFWKKSAKKNSMGVPDFDRLAIETTVITPEYTVDKFRIGKSLRKKGFRSKKFFEHISEVEQEVNTRLKSWVSAAKNDDAGDVAVTPNESLLDDKREWDCDVNEGHLHMSCGGTHISHLKELDEISVKFEVDQNSNQTGQLLVKTSAC